MIKKSLVFLLYLSFSFFLYAETIYFSADSLTAKTSENNEYTSLNGNAEVKTDDLEINADSIEIYGKDFRFISASGSIVGKNKTTNLNFTCEKLHYDRTTKIVVLEVSVKLQDTENDVEASAEIIEYNQETDIAIMQINVRLTSKDSICTSALAIYNKNQQSVLLTGSPKIERDKDIFQAQEISLDIETEEIKLDGKIRGSIVNEDKDNEKSKKPLEEKNTEKKDIIEEPFETKDGA